MSKSNLAFVIIIIALFLGFASFLISETNAAQLSKGLVRLDRLKQNTTTGAMVCAQPTTNSTESSIAITFPSDFIVNSSISNWTVNATNIDSNSTAWPGISTATNVSGKTVTFSSSDLATGTYYCFNFSGSGTLTTGSAGNKTGTIETKTSGDITIDSTNYAISINTNDQVTITALVAEDSNDLEAQATLSNTGNNFPQDTTLNYTITYGSNLSYNSNITVQAEWGLGTISGSNAPTVELLDYVIGSASNGYNNTSPVVDLVNRKISWTINSFPGNITNQTVTFKLKTNSNYSRSNSVSFSVFGRTYNLNVQTPDSTVTKKYKYSPGPTPTPTTKGPTTTTTLTPTPTPLFSSLIFLGISIEEISQDSATISVKTNKPTSAIISYGTDPDFLTQSLALSSFTSSRSIKIKDLIRNKKYYFKITTKDRSGKSITSDIFTLKTALSSSSLPLIKYDSIVISSNNRILINLDPDEVSQGERLGIVLPVNQPYEFRFSIEEHEKIKRIASYIMSESILGISNIEISNNLAESGIELFEVFPGVFSGRLISKPAVGIYQLYIKIFGHDNNITTQKIVKIKVVKPFTVLDSSSRRPIENAQVTLFIYNSKTKLFNIIQNDVISNKNPDYSKSDGIINYTLPNGKYRAQVSAIFYEDREVEFTIGSLQGEEYPEVLLRRESFSPIAQTKYYLTTIKDAYATIKDFVETHAVSTRFFNLIALISLALFVMTTIFAFIVRTHIPIISLPFYFVFHLRDILRIRHSDHISGKVIDSESKKDLSNASIQFYNQKTGELINSAKTNKLGEFISKRGPGVKKYKIVVSSKNHHSITFEDYDMSTLSFSLKFELSEKGEEERISLRGIIASGFKNIIGFTFELLLLFSLLFEIIFISTIGIYRTLPFILVSIITLLLWTFYARRVLSRHIKRLSLTH